MIKYNKINPHKNIIKQCFWDYKISLDKITEYISSDDFRLKKFIFEKIFCNSEDVLLDLMIFEKKDLELLIKNYKIPRFNNEYLSKRYNIIRNVLLNEKISIPELEWRI